MKKNIFLFLLISSLFFTKPLNASLLSDKSKDFIAQSACRGAIIMACAAMYLLSSKNYPEKFNNEEFQALSKIQKIKAYSKIPCYTIGLMLSGAVVGGLIGYFFDKYKLSSNMLIAQQKILPVAQEIIEVNQMFYSSDYQRLMDPNNLIISPEERDTLIAIYDKMVNLKLKLQSCRRFLAKEPLYLFDNFFKYFFNEYYNILNMLTVKSNAVLFHLAICQIQRFERG